MKRFLRYNGLSIVLFVIFVVIWSCGQFLTGHAEYNDDQKQHGKPEISRWDYLKSPHFVEATAENWESEFLQMAAFVLLTALLYQKGSAESHDPDEPGHKDDVPVTEDSPGPVKKGGWRLALYQYSLSLALFVLFLIAFFLHAWSGSKLYNEEQLEHGAETTTTLGYMATLRFWFESFQNWQSEFLAILSMVVLSIFLRHRGSAESKPVAAPHRECGD